METKSNKLRNKVLGADPSYKRARFEHDGETYEVRELSLAESKDIDERSKDKKGRVDAYKAMLAAAIRSIHDPATGARVFERSDEAALMRLPANSGFFAAFGEALQNLKPKKNEDEVLEGNFDAAPIA